MWQYLNTAQAAADLNRIVGIFKSIYKEKWISRGISKGGQTTIFLKYYYPNDLDVWVPYVAPLNLAQENIRINDFFEKVGTSVCREKINNYQRTLLKNREAILPLLKKHAEEKKYSFPLGLEKTFECAVMEYKFSYWQWGCTECEDIPNSDVSPETLFEHLYKSSSFNYFDEKSMLYYQPFFYQAYTEIGYYNYETEDIFDLLVSEKDKYASNICFAPLEVQLSFNNNLMKSINNFIYEHGNNMLFIYGENDAWSSTSVNILPKTNPVKMVKKGGNHSTRIKSFKEEQKEKIYSTLEEWLNLKIER